MMNELQYITINLLIWSFANCAVQAQTNLPSPTSLGEISIGEKFRFYSNEMDEEREYRVLLPNSYYTNENSFPVIYLLDGSFYHLDSYSVVTSLANQNTIPESIVVGLTSVDRESDMTPSYMTLPGESETNAAKFLNYLSKELVPIIDSMYRTLSLRILVSHSHGGIFNMYAMTNSPDLFKWHLMIDAPTHLNNYIIERKVDEFVTKNPKHRGRVFTAWSRFGWSEESWEKLVNSGVNFMMFNPKNESHSSMYLLSVYYGLKHLFSDYTYVHDKIRTLKEVDCKHPGNCTLCSSFSKLRFVVKTI